MAKNCSTPFIRKGKRVTLKWIIHKLFPQSFGNSNYWYLESCPFQIEELAFKICLISWYIECPGRVACLLTTHQIAPQTVHFLVDSEITIDKQIWKTPEVICCFDTLKHKHVPLMYLSDLQDPNKFPFMCQMTLQFGLRRCIFKKPSPTYFSAITELCVSNLSRFVYSKELYPSPINNESLKEVRRNFDNVVINLQNEINQGQPLTEKAEIISMMIGYCSYSNCVGIVFRTEEEYLYLKCEINLLDARRNIVIRSKVRETLLFKSIGWLVPIFVPEKFLKQVQNSELVFEEIDVHVNISYCRKVFKADIQSEISYSIPSCGKKCYGLKTCLENLYYNKEKSADFSVRTEAKTFRVHRCVLAARSPVLKSMLNNNMAEKRNGLAEIKEISSEVVNLLLQYIYFSELKKSVEYQNIASLYTAADRFDIPDLQKICRLELMKKVSITNFDDLLVLSHLHRDIDLKQFITLFLSTQYLSSKALSHLDNILAFERRLTTKDIRFLRRLKKDASVDKKSEETYNGITYVARKQV